MKLIAYLALTGATEASKVSASWPNNEKVADKTCDGAFFRLFNEQKSGLYDKNMSGSKKYNDISFPMDWSSMYWPEAPAPAVDSSRGRVRKDWKEYVTSYKRPSDIDTSPSLWGTKGVRPAAGMQSYLNDCWFISTLSAIAEWPERTKSMFRN
jgi:hypothetical protein